MYNIDGCHLNHILFGSCIINNIFILYNFNLIINFITTVIGSCGKISDTGDMKDVTVSSDNLTKYEIDLKILLM